MNQNAKNQQAVDKASAAIIGSSLKNLKEIVKEFASGGHSILFAGEPGVGKELFANLYAAACQRPICSINMTGIPTNLIESNLFGYDKGAFTGARQGGADGLITEDNVSKLCFFFDELGDIPSNLQAKLLRFVQFGEIQKVGKPKPITTGDPTQLRIVAASNKPECIRDDLKDRFKCLRIPTLVERYLDIPLLMKHFIKDPTVTGITEYTLNGISDILLDAYERGSDIHQWNGNVRELKQVLDNAVFLCKKRCKKRNDGTFLVCEDFPTIVWEHTILEPWEEDEKQRLEEKYGPQEYPWNIPGILSYYKNQYGSSEPYDDKSEKIKFTDLPIKSAVPLPYHYFLRNLPKEASKEDQLRDEIRGLIRMLRSELNSIGRTMSSAIDKIPTPEPHQKDQITFENTTPKTFDEKFYDYQIRQGRTVPEILKIYNLTKITVKRRIAKARIRINNMYHIDTQKYQ